MKLRGEIISENVSSIEIFSFFKIMNIIGDFLLLLISVILMSTYTRLYVTGVSSFSPKMEIAITETTMQT